MPGIGWVYLLFLWLGNRRAHNYCKILLSLAPGISPVNILPIQNRNRLNGSDIVGPPAMSFGSLRNRAAGAIFNSRGRKAVDPKTSKLKSRPAGPTFSSSNFFHVAPSALRVFLLTTHGLTAVAIE
jgi:hypothetical protein